MVAPALNPPRRSFWTRLRGRGALTIALWAALIYSLLQVEWGPHIMHPGGWDLVVRLMSGLMRPELSPELLRLGVTESWRTLAYATAGMSLALLIALPAGVLGSGILARHRFVRWLSIASFRGLLGFMRAIHELVWAWLFVAAIGLSPMAAVLALGIPYGGILGRILAERLADVPHAPLKALESAGAGPLKRLFYGYLPYVIPDFLSYTLYRFECAIRSAAILSFVGLGGLGYQIQISLDDLKYSQVSTFLLFLLAMVIAVDVWSSALRRRLVD